MNVVDLKILIPASPDFIWRFLGDLSAIPQWQEDVVSVAFLSTQREGKGTRWRITANKGSDIVAEVSAWYDTLGYEYRLVDGSNYSENQGRIRLNEVAEGTLVRWTFQYELGGVLGGLRNAVRLKRNTSNQIQASLRNLHQVVLQESGGISTHEAKASMRDAPDVDIRLSYQPRHSSAFQDPALDESLEAEDFALGQPPFSFEPVLEAEDFPPILESDTKPNPIVLAAASASNTPERRDEIVDDTRPIEVEVFLSEPPLPSPEPLEAAPEPVPSAILSPQPSAEDGPQNREPSAPVAAPIPVLDPADSAYVSVFEIFGIRRPSEASAQPQAPVDTVRELLADRPTTAERPAYESERIFDLDAGSATDPSDSTPLTDPTTIVGLRRTQRRRKTRLRTHT